MGYNGIYQQHLTTSNNMILWICHLSKTGEFITICHQFPSLWWEDYDEAWGCWGPLFSEGEQGGTTKHLRLLSGLCYLTIPKWCRTCSHLSKHYSSWVNHLCSFFFRVTMRFWTHPHFFHPVRCTWPCNILRCSVTLRPDGQPPPAAPATKPRNLHRLCRDRHPRDDRQAIAAMAAMAEWSHDAPRWLSRGRHRLIGLGWFGIRKLGPSLAMHVAKTSVESHQELIWEDGSRTC